VSSLLAELPPGERTVLVLRLVDEMSVAQTSEVIGASERVVETLTARGLARLGR
jgi:DNA-directed RNA polymerase specialized sigma24 family protein